MTSRFSKSIFLIFILATILLSGCKTPIDEPENNTIVVNMTDNVTVSIEPNTTISNTTIINETVTNVTELNVTNTTLPIVNNTVVINNTDEESEYSKFDDTSLIEESIDDIEELN